ncbi:hypothetical protein CPB86DRAFT_735500 [Serendipita vermifera]|nr:hypothetical protein CPB86DRAFT_735500 [Serendipita vermifera]
MPHYRGLIGIISIEGNIRDQYPLVQTRCYYNIVDVYSIAELVQDYHSSAPISRDVEYVFPLPPGAAVCSFKAVIDDKKTIKGVVKEKSEAKTEYKAAVAQGKTAGLLEQRHPDVFRVSLGNIKPNQKISVHMSLISLVNHDGSSPQALRITMPTSIAPRYGSPPTNIPWWKPNNHNRFELTVAIQMNKAITSVSSPSHPIGLTLGCAEKELKGDFEPSKAFVYLGESAFLEKDIVIVISSQGLDMPRCSVERWLASEGAEETTDAYALTLVPKFDLPPLPSQEYIFLVDRSGSMEGGRMDSVKASLQIMLRSLPSRDTTFNIVSFGDRYTSLWSTSQMYSAEAVKEASNHVDTFRANYGGTQLRSALQFAFNSRISVKSPFEDTTPTAIFVLTDGEAWDLSDSLNEISTTVKTAKEKDTLLRTFVLGVGNQVSTAMCEGIVRAGKGAAVYVTEGEKPDSKLMELLRAARGGVIEDLVIEWGTSTNENDNIDTDENFEVVSNPRATQAATKLPPLSLFDDQTTGEAPELGPQKVIVNLPPPPVIQQAPKSDKLPIPLYPGFRCSIFAIIKQGTNPGPYSPQIKITGNVLGRDVTLQIPVNPVRGNNTIIQDTGTSKLLHTLAAKALIQVFEDMKSTPETKAQIERLGKRYSLATSVTSFLAIDEETHAEREAAVKQEVLQGSRNPFLPPSRGRPVPIKMPPIPPAPAGMIPSKNPYDAWRRLSAPGSTQSQGSGENLESISSTDERYALVSALFQRKAQLSARPTPDLGPPVGYARGRTQEEEDWDEVDSDDDSSDDDRVRSARQPAKCVEAKAGSAASLSIEALARAQEFDGSFPSTPQHIQMVTSGDNPSLPSALADLGNDEAIKKMIWVTLLTIACMERRFAGERVVWEFLADKAKDYVLDMLQTLCQDTRRVESLMRELTAAANAAV